MTFVDLKPRLRVDAPPFVPYSYGLASVARSVPDSDHHSGIGMDWQSPYCTVASVTSDPCYGFDPTPDAKAANAGCADVQFADPFTVYAMVEQSPVGIDVEAFLRAALEGGEWPAVEGYVQTLLAATDVSLGSGDPDLALAAIENALAVNYGGQGVIHTSRGGATLLASRSLLTVTGGRLTTMLGTPVAAQAWNVGSPPPPVKTFIIHGTGPVFYRRSDVQVIGDLPSALDRRVNALAALAERTWVVGWDCVNFSATAAVA